MKKIIIYIDDEEALCDLFELSFDDLGPSIKTFSNAQDALEFLNHNSAEVVFCDHQMPGMSGVQMYASLATKMPFYLVTGDLSLDLESIGEEGIKKILYKPVCFDEVRSIVKSHLSE